MIDEKKLIEIGDWIPCSEEKPGMFESVLVTAIIEGDSIPIVYLGVRMNENEYALAGVANPDDYIVTAWMPLPEPWEGEEGCAENK